MEALRPVEVEILAAIAEHEDRYGRGIGRAALCDASGLELAEFIRVLFYLRDQGYLVVERASAIADTTQAVSLTDRGAAQLQAELAARLRLPRPGPRSRLSDLGA